MSKHRVTVLKVVSMQMSVTAAAAAHGISRQHLQSLLRRVSSNTMTEIHGHVTAAQERQAALVLEAASGG